MKFNIFCFLIAILLFSFSATAQTEKKTESARPASGSVSGKVFLITEAGDIKPARFAHVYLLYLWSGRPPAQQTNEDKTGATAGKTFLDKYVAELQSEGEDLKDPSSPTDESFQCKRRLLTISKALSQTIDWIEESGKSKQLLSVDTDEDGTFQILRVPPGGYSIMARGRAGANDAFWKNDVLKIQSGRTVSVKLVSPETSCLNLP